MSILEFSFVRWEIPGFFEFVLRPATDNHFIQYIRGILYDVAQIRIFFFGLVLNLPLDISLKVSFKCLRCAAHVSE